MSTGEPRIALIHDELVRRGGAEIVFEELVRLLPRAEVYALYAGTPRMRLNGRERKVHTSFLQKFPRWFRRHPGRVLPFLSYAAEQFDFSGFDLVISSASGFAKAVVTRSNVPHLCYCHTPTRYLWDATHEILAHRSAFTRWALRALMHYLRVVDFAAAQRVDVWLANSTYTQRRIAAYYRADSTVVYPPIDTDFFTPHPFPEKDVGLPPKSYFLVVGRLTPTKYFDQAIAVCEKLGYPLVVVGTGHERERLRKGAGKKTHFVGSVPRTVLRSLYRGARALLQPGIEDFGMATAESLACGTPVIALGRGGVLEIGRTHQEGILYPDQRPEALAEAIRQFLDRELSFQPERLQKRVLRFSRQRFQEQIREQVALALTQKEFKVES